MAQRRVAVLLNDVCSDLIAGAQILSELLHDTKCPQPQFAAMTAMEQHRNETIHELLLVLSRSYFLALSREDLHTLVSRLGDIGKSTRKCSNRVSICEMADVSPTARRLADTFLQQVNGLAATVRELGHDSRPLKHCSEVKTLESSARGIAVGGFAELLLTMEDPIILIKMKDLFCTLELTAYSAKLAADWIEAIILKHGAA